MSASPVLLEGLELGGHADPWERAGFAVAGDGSVRLGAVVLRFAGGQGGIRSWTLRGVAGAELDGLPTRVATADPQGSGDAPPHPNGAIQLDHVVAMSARLERTLAALQAAGLDLRRTRDTEHEGRAIRQAFYRLGEVVLEVVGDVPPDGPARFWGVVVVVADLDVLAEQLGDCLGTPRDAVQEGRRIATARTAAGLGLPIAFMTPAPPR